MTKSTKKSKIEQKIYLAGSCASDDRTIMKNIADALLKHNYHVYCPFDLKIKDAWEMSQEDWSTKVYDADIAALDKADIVLVISPGRIGSAGTNWEQGYAFGTGKKVIVFQYTKEKTSLMTFKGCSGFVNSSLDTITNDVINVLLGKKPYDTECKTILT